MVSKRARTHIVPVKCLPSTVFAAVQFVLDTSNIMLRGEERKLLLHDGLGAHMLSAFVEITLDNSDGRLPMDKSEVVIRRVIGLKKDDYFIDRKHSSKSEVLRPASSADVADC